MRPTHLLPRRFLLASLLALPACATVQPASLDTDAEHDLADISAYLNAIHTLHARFLQDDPNGAVTAGDIWLQRPGLLRLTYDPPSQAALLVADGRLVLHDAATDATTRMALSRTPLAMLLGPEIALTGPISVTRFDRAPTRFTLTLVSTDHPTQGSLTLTLARPPLALTELLLTDPRGNITRLVLQNLQTGIAPPPAIFRPLV